MELQLGVSPSSAHQDPPLPHPAFLRCGDAPELEGSAEEEEDREEERVRNLLAVHIRTSAVAGVCCRVHGLNEMKVVKYLMNAHISLH